MFDGKIFRGLAETPIRSTARANNAFAEADPDPLTFANFMTKSLTATMFFIAGRIRFEFRLSGFRTFFRGTAFRAGMFNVK